jgi:hypothetical protein
MKYLIIITLCIAVTTPCSAKVYKWVDEDGVTQFSTFPPADINKDFKTVKTSNHNTVSIQDNIPGTWLYQKDNNNYELTVKSKEISISKIRKNRKIKVMTASWILEGKVLTLKYKTYKYYNKVGKSEKFFVSKITKNVLILVSDKTNERIQYQREGTQKNSLFSHSPLLQKLIGYWKGTTIEQDIKFNENGSFIIKGNSKKYKFKMYEGNWNYDDPKLLFNFKIDLATPKEGITKAGKTEIYLVKKLTKNELHIRSKKTGQVNKYTRH